MHAEPANPRLNPFKNGLIQAVYVIHARTFTGRADFIKAQLDKMEIPFEFVEAYDVEEINDAVIQRFQAPTYDRPPGKLSCTLKHFEAMRRIAGRGHRLALVLEDDVVLADNFNAELSRMVEETKGLTPPYTIQIGCGSNMYVPQKRLRPGQRLYEVECQRATDSYLIGAETARLRLAWLDQNKIHLPTGHLFHVIDRDKGIRIYWSEPTIVEQGSMNGRFPTTMDPGRSHKPLWYLKWKFAFSRWRKKNLARSFPLTGTFLESPRRHPPITPSGPGPRQ
jgi:glycosyl transferase, family 25